MARRRIVCFQHLVLFHFLFSITDILSGQTNAELPLKHEYDKYFIEKALDYELCSILVQDWSQNDLGSPYGDAASKMLEGQLTMHETTGDLGYLYKFMQLSLCMMEHRADVHNSTTHPLYDSHSGAPPVWTGPPIPGVRMYQDGYIIGAFARFAHYVKVQQSWIAPLSVHPFAEFNGSNVFNESFTTFGDYADWISTKSLETFTWYIGQNYWEDAIAMKVKPGDKHAAAINMQVGFGKAALYLGNTYNLNAYQVLADTMAGHFKALLHFNDQCLFQNYLDDVLIENITDNAYWWYHSGWSVKKHACPIFQYPDYTAYIQNIEDISHGAITAWLPYEFYHNQTNTPFTLNDMIRFRNMFSKKIYLGANIFANAVDGNNGPIYYKDENSNEVYGGSPSNNYFKAQAISYIQFADFDGADATATAPNVYNIIMDFYRDDCTSWPDYPGMNSTLSLPSIPRPPYLTNYGYNGQMSKGHAELVSAQWERECVSLTLNKRDLVYDQNFWVDYDLNVTPYLPNAGDLSFAEPQFTDQNFIVRSGVHSEMVAGNSIQLNAGFKVESGATFKAYTNVELSCIPGESQQQRPAANNNEQPAAMEYKQKSIHIKPDYPENENLVNIGLKSINMFPNPTSGKVTIIWSNYQSSIANIHVRNNASQSILEATLENGGSLELESLTPGLYTVEIRLENDVYRKKLVKK